MTRTIPTEALGFGNADPSSLALDQISSEYAHRITPWLLRGRRYIIDPDAALEQDYEAYKKVNAEPIVASKIEKRAMRAVGADWSIVAEDPSMRGVASLVEHLLLKIRKRLPIALRTLSRKATLRGFATARINGCIQNVQLSGDYMPRHWWLPTELVDVGKERWRIHRVHEGHEDPTNPTAEWRWAIQDLYNFRWYYLDTPMAPVGLRRIDYVWAKSGEEEEDLGYGHGLMRAIYHKWYMLTHLCIYAMEGAEGWAYGKTVITTPPDIDFNVEPGANGTEGFSQRQRQHEELAKSFSNMLSRHVLVVQDRQTVTVLERPDSGHRSVMDMIERIDKEFNELILGRRTDLQTEIDVDPDILTFDRNVLELAMDDLLEAVFVHNRFHFEALGWTLEELRLNIRFEIARRSALDTESAGKSLQIAQSLGLPVDRDDAYEKLSIKPVEPDSPNAVHAPQAGQPISGGHVRASGDEGAPAPTEPAPAQEGVYAPPPVQNQIQVQT